MTATVAFWSTGVGLTDDEGVVVERSQAVVPRATVMLTAPMSVTTRTFMMRLLLRWLSGFPESSNEREPVRSATFRHIRSSLCRLVCSPTAHNVRIVRRFARNSQFNGVGKGFHTVAPP